MIFMYLSICFVLIEWFVNLHDWYSLFFQPLLQFILAPTTPTCAPPPPPPPEAATEPPCRFENGPGKKAALGVNPRMVMERLGTFWDPDDRRETVESEEMVALFVEDEPSLDEVKEAFRVFDKNGDGFIDANELRNVLSDMGFLQISGSDCRKMIGCYDGDEDGKISFREFLKVVEDGFC